MKKAGIIRSVVMAIAFTLFALTRTSILEDNTVAIIVSAVLMAGVLISFLAQALRSVQKGPGAQG